MTIQDFSDRVAREYRVAGRNVHDAATDTWVNEVEYCGRVVDDYLLCVDLAVLAHADLADNG